MDGQDSWFQIEGLSSPDERAIITPDEQEIIDIMKEYGGKSSLEIKAMYFNLFRKRGLLIDGTTAFFYPEYLSNPDMITSLDELRRQPPGEIGEEKIFDILIFDNEGQILLVKDTITGYERWSLTGGVCVPWISSVCIQFKNFNEGLRKVFQTNFGLNAKDLDIYMYNRYFTRNVGCPIGKPGEKDYDRYGYFLAEHGQYSIVLSKDQEEIFNCGKGIKDFCWVSPDVAKNEYVKEYYRGVRIDPSVAGILNYSYRYPDHRMLQKPIKVEF